MFDFRYGTAVPNPPLEIDLGDHEPSFSFGPHYDRDGQFDCEVTCSCGRFVSTGSSTISAIEAQKNAERLWRAHVRKPAPSAVAKPRAGATSTGDPRIRPAGREGPLTRDVRPQQPTRKPGTSKATAVADGAPPIATNRAAIA